jgi:HTH-type transcriptional regulator/antitoxin HigA
MRELKYTIIKSTEQYFSYCNILEQLLIKQEKKSSDEIELITLLIEKWDKDQNSFGELDPVEFIKALMEENNLKSRDLVKILTLSKGTISKILNYHKGLSKETIRKLSVHFSVSQESFNRPYKLVNPLNKHFRNARLMNTKKDIKKTIIV